MYTYIYIYIHIYVYIYIYIYINIEQQLLQIYLYSSLADDLSRITVRCLQRSIYTHTYVGQ